MKPSKTIYLLYEVKDGVANHELRAVAGGPCVARIYSTRKQAEKMQRVFFPEALIKEVKL